MYLLQLINICGFPKYCFFHCFSEKKKITEHLERLFTVEFGGIFSAGWPTQQRRLRCFPEKGSFGTRARYKCSNQIN
jgi:hypothetical protein